MLVGKELSPVMKQVVESVKIIAILSFLSSKSCHFYFAILEQFYLSLLNNTYESNIELFVIKIMSFLLPDFGAAVFSL